MNKVDYISKWLSDGTAQEMIDEYVKPWEMYEEFAQLHTCDFKGHPHEYGAAVIKAFGDLAGLFERAHVFNDSSRLVIRRKKSVPDLLDAAAARAEREEAKVTESLQKQDAVEKVEPLLPVYRPPLKDKS
jgi:hypothetical protein